MMIIYKAKKVFSIGKKLSGINYSQSPDHPSYKPQQVL